MQFMRQSTPHDCGPACLVTVASRWNKVASVDQVARWAGTTSAGTSLLGMQTAARQLGLDVQVVKGDLETLKNPPTPFIAHLKSSHYVVVLKAGKGPVEVFDPLHGKATWPRSKFGELWSGYTLFVQRGSPFRVVATGALRRFLPLLRPHVPSLVVVGVASLLLVFFGILNSFYFRFLIDEVLPSQAEVTLHVLSVGVLVLTTLTVLLEAVRKHLVLHFSQKIDVTLVFGYLKHVLDLPLGFFERLRSGDLLARLDDIQRIRSALADVSVSLVMDTLMVAAVGTVLFLQAPLLFWVAVGFGLVSSLLVWVFAGYFHEKQRQLMTDRSTIQSYLIEAFAGFGTVKALNAAGLVHDEFEKRQMDSVWTYHKLTVTQNTQGLLVSFIDGVGGNVLYWVGCVFILAGQFTLGQLISFNVLLAHFLNPFKRLLKLQPNLQGAALAAARLNEILDLGPEVADRKWLRPDRFVGRLEFRDVQFGYVPDRPVLRGLSLTIEPGERIGFVGASGCGKTTLLKLVLQFYQPAQGEVRIDGLPLADVDPRHWRSRLGYVPQDVFLFSGTIAENIGLGHPGACLETIVEAARQAGAHEFILALPDRYETRLNERATILSGGERQRLILARALVGDHDLLLFDEATSHLDAVSEALLQATLDGLRTRGKTTLVVAHRLATVTSCDRIVVLDRGRIVETGNHPQLVAAGGRYARLWQGMAR